MRRTAERRVYAVAAVWLLLFPVSGEIAQETTTPPGSVYPNVSWALGMVVPQGAGLQGGGSVRWEGVRNVTAHVMLPNITQPDGIIYAVLSVMTSDKVVLQAAAGAAPGRDGWYAYSWCIEGLGSGPLNYRWVVNGSAPQMAPKGNISLSIFEAAGVWNLAVSDLDSGALVEKAFPPGIGATLRGGDQEVFALESYTRSAAIFRTMGNLTLEGVWLDGRPVARGFYSYGQWDPNHSPVFIVGSSGSSPPSFIYLGEGAPGSYFWTYSGSWYVQGNLFTGVGAIMAVLLLAGAISVIGAAALVTRRHRVEGPQAGRFFLKT